MSVDAEFKSSPESDSETRPVLGPAGNRVRVSEFPEQKRKKESLKKSQQVRRMATRLPESILRANASVDSSCSSDSSCSVSSLKKLNLRRTRTMEQKILTSVKIIPQKVDLPTVSRSPSLSRSPSVSSSPSVSRSTSLSRSPSPSPAPSPAASLKRCDWITPNSDPLYASFHDEEWGVPVHEDTKLFELLVLTQALAELNWPTILNKRDAFRKLFDNFDIASVAKFIEKKILAVKATGKTLLSEAKLRAVVENAKQILKIQEEFGSFDKYCWSFVNHQPIKNGFKYARQVPVKTSKAEVMSKDLMKRGFRCVGPTVVYSFMQVTGIVNDHLLSCFRYQECNSNVQKDCEEQHHVQKVENMEVVVKALDKMCLSPPV